MSNWRNVEIGKVIDFNPSESIKKGTIAKKIPMDKLKVFEKKIKGFEFSEYSAGPKFRNGDTLVAKITPCLENGKTAQVDVLAENEVAFGSSEFIVLRENENTINDFIFYLAKSPAFRKRAIGCMEGTSGRKRVNEGALKLQVLPIPDKLTQQKIAKVLSDLDSKIELNNRINTELEAMAKTLYDYWFVQFDFPYSPPSEGCPQDGVGIGKPYKTSGGKMVWNDELKREIPEGWEVGELKDIANITMGQSPPGESYNEEGNGMIFYQGCTDFGNRYPTIRKFTTSPTRFAKQGDILLSVRAPVGTLNISKEDCCIGRGLACMNSKNNAITYLFGVMVNLKQIFDRRNVSGTTFGSITKDDLFSLPVIIPTKKTVRAFQNLVFPACEKQNKIELENQELASLRDWLLPMLMNGQVSVGDGEEELGMVAEESPRYGK
ncbi:restriction endonuclease subunit S [Flavobacterium sp. GSN2]|nr:restriction endonuclease subunit S [Flavobacterium sp. GSN2]